MSGSINSSDSEPDNEPISVEELNHPLAPRQAGSGLKESTHGTNYFLIFLALCGCTLLSVVTDFLPFGGKTLLAVLVLSVAVAKALFVMVYFMHLKFERGWKYILLAPTFILAAGLPLALLPDIGMHYYKWTDAAREGEGEPTKVLEER